MIRLRGMVLAGLALTVPAGGLRAQVDSSPAVSLREMALTLMRRGVEGGQARLVLAAAQLLLTSELGNPPKPRNAEQDSIARTVAGEPSNFTGVGLLRLASELAVETNDAATAAAAAAIARSRELMPVENSGLTGGLTNRAKGIGTFRGAAGGPLYREGTLLPEAETEYAFAFEGKRVVNGIVVGASDPKADLQCTLLEGKKVVARNDGPGSGCAIKWDQKPSGTLTLRIRNAGAKTYFVLTSN